MSDINAGSVSVDIVPDATGFAEKLRAKLGNLAVQVLAELDDKEADAKLAALTRKRDATVNADADTAKAEAELDHAARNRTAHIDADTRSGVRNIGLLTAAIVGLGPALVPVTAAVAGLVGALGAPLAAAGGGLTVFGLIAGKAISDTMKVSKQIDALSTKLASLTDPAARAQVQAQMKTLEQSLTGPQKAFLKAKVALTGAFGDLVKRAGPAIFSPLVKGMDALGKILPALAPLLKSVSGAISDLIGAVARSAQGGALKGFLDFLTRASGPAIRSFATILGNIATGFGGLIAAMQPLSGSVMHGLERMTKSFADFGSDAGQNAGFQGFLKYVRDTGPQVVATIEALVRAGANLGRALAPLGAISLGGLRVMADVIAKIPPHVLGAIASSIAAVVVGVKAWTIAQGALDAVMAANPIGIVVVALGALAAGLIYAYKNSKTFRDGCQAAFHAVAAAGRWLWNNVLQPVFKLLVEAIGHVMLGWGKMLSALGHVPGFGWAKTAANLMQGAGQKAIDLANHINKIPNQAITTVRVDGVSAAMAATSSYLQMMKNLNGTIATTYIRQVRQGHIAGGGHPVYAGGSADGGTVGGPRTPYGDKLLYLLAPGEEVVSNRNGQADHWRPVLKAINAGMLASGGTAQMQTMVSHVQHSQSYYTTVGGSHGVSLQQEIRGVLSIDRNGMAYIHGVARDTVGAYDARQQQAARTAALGVSQ